jgi:hypothetical protein
VSIGAEDELGDRYAGALVRQLPAINVGGEATFASHSRAD